MEMRSISSGGEVKETLSASYVFEFAWLMKRGGYSLGRMGKGGVFFPMGFHE